MTDTYITIRSRMGNVLRTNDPEVLNKKVDFKPISKFPPLCRSLTINNPKQYSVAIMRELRQLFPELLIVECVDEYEDTLTYNLILQNHNHTFTRDEIKDIDARLESFKEEHDSLPQK